MARSRAVDDREPGQIREEAALSEAAHAPRVSLAGAEPGGTLEASVSTRGARSISFGMRIALATCDWLPELDPDDAPLRAALGDQAEPAIWSDPDVDWSAYDVVLVRTIWDYFERHAEFLEWLDRVPVPMWNPADTLRWNSEKTYLRELEAAGIRTIPTAWEGEVPWEEAIVKPTVAGGSLGLRRAEKGEPIEPGFMAQPFLPGHRERRRAVARLLRRRVQPRRPQDPGRGRHPRPARARRHRHGRRADGGRAGGGGARARSRRAATSSTRGWTSSATGCSSSSRRSSRASSSSRARRGRRGASLRRSSAASRLLSSAAAPPAGRSRPPRC